MDTLAGTASVTDATATATEAVASERAIARLRRNCAQIGATGRAAISRAGASIPRGRTASGGSAALISTVNAAARTAGVQIGALQVEIDTTAAGREQKSGIVPMRVRGDGAGDIAGIAHFLATAVESGVRRCLSIRELAITPTADPHRHER